MVVTDDDVVDIGRGIVVGAVDDVVRALTGRISATLQSGSSISDWMRFPACRVA